MWKGGVAPRYSKLQNDHHRSTTPMGNGRTSADARYRRTTPSSTYSTTYSTPASVFSTPSSTASSASSAYSPYKSAATNLKSATTSSAAYNAKRRVPARPSSYHSSMTHTPASRSTSAIYELLSITPSSTARSSSVGNNSDSLDYYKYDRLDSGHRFSGDSGFDSLLDLGATMVERSRGRSAHRKRRSADARALRSLSGYANRYPGYSASSTASQPSERSSSLATSRVSSVSSVRSAVDGEIDYKKLYEREKAENERLLKRIDDLESQLRRQKLSESQSENGLNRRVGKVLQENGSSGMVMKSTSGSSLDEQERRSFERKIAEMEDELQTVDQLRSDNQRLKDENGALIRVISKLSK